MFLTNAQRIMGLDRYNGPRWVSVDDPRKSSPDEIFRYLRGNVYYSREWRLAHGINMLVRGEVALSLWFNDMADIRAFPDGSMRAVNGTEHLLFIYSCIFSHMRFTDDQGDLHPHLQKVWSNDVDKAYEARKKDRPLRDYKPVPEVGRKVSLEFIGEQRDERSFQRKAKEDEFVCFSPGSPDGAMNAACADVGKNRFFETKNLELESEKKRFGETLQGIVMQCEEIYEKWPCPEAMPTRPARRVFYLPGPDA